MTPLIVIVGFLGAGKTTFLQNLVPALGAEGLIPSLLINDYQNARIDGERFRGVIDEVTTLNGDCVCCGSRDELLAALEQFEHRTSNASPRRFSSRSSTVSVGSAASGTMPSNASKSARPPIFSSRAPTSSPRNASHPSKNPSTPLASTPP